MIQYHSILIGAGSYHSKRRFQIDHSNGKYYPPNVQMAYDWCIFELPLGRVHWSDSGTYH